MSDHLHCNSVHGLVDPKMHGLFRQLPIEPPSVPLTMQGRPTCHTLPVMRVQFAQALTGVQTLTMEFDLHP